MQRSDSFILGALLSFSGGLQDAYTFNVRDRVFANAQTGNVGLMPLEYERIANMSVSFACAMQVQASEVYCLRVSVSIPYGYAAVYF